MLPGALPLDFGVGRLRDEVGQVVPPAESCRVKEPRHSPCVPRHQRCASVLQFFFQDTPPHQLKDWLRQLFTAPQWFFKIEQADAIVSGVLCCFMFGYACACFKIQTNCRLYIYSRSWVSPLSSCHLTQLISGATLLTHISSHASHDRLGCLIGIF